MQGKCCIYFLDILILIQMKRSNSMSVAIYCNISAMVLICSWYTFDVRHLLPVAASDVGAELAKLVGGADKLAQHAEKILNEGGEEKLGVALEIAEYAAEVAGAPTEVHLIRSKILRALERRESSLMGSSIYRAAALDSEAKL